MNVPFVEELFDKFNIHVVSLSCVLLFSFLQ